MKFLMKQIKSLFKFYSSFYISYRYLILILFILLTAISTSVFDTNVDTLQNLSTIRTAFSSIVGFLLESSSRKYVCKDKITIFRNALVGIIALIVTSILVMSYYLNIEKDNSSLILLKNTLFSCIGFLISSSEKCIK